jgi:hypothetical protein
MGTTIEVEIPTTIAALAHIDRLMRGATVDLSLHLRGRLHTAPQAAPPDKVNFPSRGEWSSMSVGVTSASQLFFQVARSDWFTNVVQPLQLETYVPVEIRIPNGTLAAEFRAALACISEAEKAYNLGDDPSTFTHCRGALDALPSAKKHIYDRIDDGIKRDSVDGYAHALGGLLHSGRHVAAGGDRAGTFPVDHRDAAFALAATKLLVAYTSRLIDTT